MFQALHCLFKAGAVIKMQNNRDSAGSGRCLHYSCDIANSGIF